MPRISHRVKETSTTTGTGTLTLAGAATGFRTFVAGVGDGTQVYYHVKHQTAAEWESGIGTVTDAASDTLARTKVLKSSNGDAAVNFSAGTKDVFCAPLADLALATREALWPKVGATEYRFDDDGSTALPSGWSWLNQDTCTHEVRDGRLSIICPAGAGNIWHGIERDASTGSTWIMEACLGSEGVTNHAGGIHVGNSTALKSMFRKFNSGGWVWPWDNPDTLGSLEAAMGEWAGSEYWLRLTKNASTDFDWSISPDGASFAVISAGFNYSAVTMTKWGFGGFPDNAGAQSVVSCRLFRVYE